VSLATTADELGEIGGKAGQKKDAHAVGSSHAMNTRDAGIRKLNVGEAR
jgi:hypothetical protein